MIASLNSCSQDAIFALTEKKELSSPSFSRAAIAKYGEEASVAYMGNVRAGDEAISRLKALPLGGSPADS